jgi:hypothetical protein
MKAMKTVVMILALVFTVSLVGSASNAVLAANSQTVNLEMSKTSTSSASNVSKAKKVHHKAHKKPSGKKTKK